MVGPSVLLAGRDFTAFLLGRIEISASPLAKRISIHVGEQSFFVADQIIDVNQIDKPATLELPFLDARRSR